MTLIQHLPSHLLFKTIMHHHKRLIIRPYISLLFRTKVQFSNRPDLSYAKSMAVDFPHWPCKKKKKKALPLLLSHLSLYLQGHYLKKTKKKTQLFSFPSFPFLPLSFSSSFFCRMATPNHALTEWQPLITLHTALPNSSRQIAMEHLPSLPHLVVCKYVLSCFNSVK